MLLFWYVILQSQKFYVADASLNIHQQFVSMKDNKYESSIQLDTIDLVRIEASDTVTRHVVQKGETLSHIASKYGTTVDSIKDINNIRWSFLKVGQELFITDVPGIIHVVKDDSNFLVFANKHNLNLEDIMTLNYVTNEETIIREGTEVFLPITIEKAYELGIEEKPKPIPQPQIIPNRQVVTTKTKPSTHSSTSSKQQTAVVKQQVDTSKLTTQQVDNAQQSWPYAWLIEAKRRDSSAYVSNGFYAWFCTYWVAKNRPDIFPYVSETVQERPFGGNARQWINNASNAWFRTGQSPAIWSIAVFAVGGPWYSSYGHVGIVKRIDWEKKIFLLSEMNGPGGKHVVTHRWISINDWNISWYIY